MMIEFNLRAGLEYQGGNPGCYAPPGT